MNPHDLRNRYKSETGNHCTERHGNDYCWSGEYVAWLEKKLIEAVDKNDKM